MGTQYFGINRGGQLKDVVRDTTTTAKAVEVAINDTAGLSSLDISSLLNTLQQYIYNLRFGISGVPPVDTPGVINTLFVRPIAHGDQTGRTWEDALALKDLPALLSTVSPGGTIYLAAWDGNYTINAAVNSIVITRLASQGAVTIKGANQDLSDATVTINGTRDDYVEGVNYSRTDPEHDGYNCFVLTGELTDVTIKGINFTNMGYCFHILANLTRTEVSDCTYFNVALFYNAEVSLGGGASLPQIYTHSNTAIRRVIGSGHEYGGMRSNQTIPDVLTMEDCWFDGLHRRGSSTGFAMAVHLFGPCALAVFNRCRMDGSQWGGVLNNTYWNGDGYATETGVVEVRYTDCQANGSSDGGWDDKAQKVTRTRCISRDNKINFRTWGADITMVDCESHLPFQRGGQGDHCIHLQIDGGSNPTHNLSITGMVITGDSTHKKPVFTIDNPSGCTFNISFDNYDFNLPSDNVIADLSLSAGATVNVTWGSPKAGCPSVNTGTNLMNADGNTYSAEALAIFAAAPLDVSITWMQQVEAAIAAMKAASVWTIRDVLYVPCSLSEDAALINWKSPGTNDLTNTGTPIWTRKRGWSKTDDPSQLDSGLLANDGGNAYQQNDCHLACVVTQANDATKGIGQVGSSDTGTASFRINAFAAAPSNQVQARINSTSSSSFNTVTTSIGHTLVCRTGASGVGACQGYRNGVALTSGASAPASAAVVAETFKILPQNAGVIPTDIVGMGSFGAHLDSTAAAADAALWKTFFNAIIPGLIP